MLLASFIVPLYLTGAWHPPAAEAGPARQVFYYGMWFLFYAVNYFVVIFFNCALVACATIRMGGGEPTVGDGFRLATARLPAIMGWALISATVGLILHVIEERSEKIGQIVSALLGTAWSLVTYLVVPIMVVENKGPFDAFKDSSALLKKTWGEQVIGNSSFGLVFFVLGIPAYLLIFLGIASAKGPALLACFGLAVAYFIVLALVQSALQAIFQTAVYLYARNGQVPEGFEEEYLSGAMTSR
jgi:heme/copper-type cytochrome/quinol oxidase subunit 3